MHKDKSCWFEMLADWSIARYILRRQIHPNLNTNKPLSFHYFHYFISRFTSLSTSIAMGKDNELNFDGREGWSTSFVNNVKTNTRANYICQGFSISFYYKIYDQDKYCMRNVNTWVDIHILMSFRWTNLNFHYIPKNDLENLPTLLSFLHSRNLPCVISFITHFEKPKTSEQFSA